MDLDHQKREREERRPLFRLFSPTLRKSGTLVVLRGDREAVVYGCRKILYYGEREIRLSVGRCPLFVKGERLYCSSFSGGAVTVEGEIRLIGYETPTGDSAGVAL